MAAVGFAERLRILFVGPDAFLRALCASNQALIAALAQAWAQDYLHQASIAYLQGRIQHLEQRGAELSAENEALKQINGAETIGSA